MITSETLTAPELKLNDTIQAVLTLEGQPLGPSPRVNSVLQNFVKAVEHTKAMPMLLPETVKRVRRLCAESETAMEMHYAEYITKAPSARKAIEAFPYIDNYRRLGVLECDLLRQLRHDKSGLSKTAIIGSGPLPLTSYFYALAGHDIVNVDSNAEAISRGAKVLQKLQIPHSNLCSPGEVAPLKTHDINTVVIAALAGETLDQKLAIIHHVVSELPKGGRILLRSAKGARQLLYPAIALDDDICMALGLVHVTSFHPPREVINSIEVYEKCE